MNPTITLRLAIAIAAVAILAVLVAIAGTAQSSGTHVAWRGQSGPPTATTA